MAAVSEREALVALNLVPDMGPITFGKLAGAFGSAEAILNAAAEDIAACPGLGAKRGAALAEEFRRADPSREIARAAKMGIRVIARCDSEYPAILKKIHDPPLVLYCFGDIAAFSVPAVAMVGTRTPSAYGDETARRFAYSVASAGYCVVSGMARGIDTASHKGALDAHGRTIGVLGGAIDCFYPQENRELARNAAKTGGLIVSEFPLGRKPDRGTFPMRNRIISGLSRVTLVVEAASRSGSLITASQAMEQGRQVMAIPGRIDVPNSLGCNKLIRDGAAMALCPEDVLDEMNSLALDDGGSAGNDGLAGRDGLGEQPGQAGRTRPAAVSAPFIPLSAEEQRVFDVIGHEETHCDEVIRRSGIDAGRANALLLALQLKGVAELLPGGWVRLRKRN